MRKNANWCGNFPNGAESFYLVRKKFHLLLILYLHRSVWYRSWGLNTECHFCNFSTTDTFDLKRMFKERRPEMEVTTWNRFFRLSRMYLIENLYFWLVFDYVCWFISIFCPSFVLLRVCFAFLSDFRIKILPILVECYGISKLNCNFNIP